jgi:hypothetical protein
VEETKDLENYWRSHEGAEIYEEVLDAHFTRLFSTCAQVELIQELDELDIFVMQEHPFAGVNTIITKGMSAFILDGGERVEYAITLRQKYSIDWAAAALATLVAAVLHNRQALPEHQVIRNVDFGGIGTPVRVQHMIVLMGHWFQEGEFHINNFYPGHIFELMPVLEEEALLASSDVQAFFQRGRAGLIDTLDLCRSDVGSTH